MGHSFRGTGFGLLIAVLLVAPVRAASPLNPADPIGFFTNLASRLLKMEMNLELNHLQIYPTNQYTPAVHRLLQVSANIYEATTNRFNDDYPHLPTLFRPRFTNENGSIYISGFVEEVGTNLLGVPIRDLLLEAERAALQPTDLVYGIPVVLGAKKGHPSFSQFMFEKQSQIGRKLEVVKANPNGPPIQTNQLHFIAITNLFGLVAWNPYSNTYARSLSLIGSFELTSIIKCTATNSTAVLVSNQISRTWSTNVNAGLWSGWKSSPGLSVSFVSPLRDGASFLTPSAYLATVDGDDSITSITVDFPKNSKFAVPEFSVEDHIHLRFCLVDTAANQIVDVFTLNSRTGIGAETFVGADYTVNGIGFWDKIRVDGSYTNESIPTIGISNQIQVALGNIPTNGMNWPDYSPQMIDSLRCFVGLPPRFTTVCPVQQSHSMQVPFTPVTFTGIGLIWEINDPAVRDFFAGNSTVGPGALAIIQQSFNSPSYQQQPALWLLKEPPMSYRPWGTSGTLPLGSSDAFDSRIKDPLARSVDDRIFPDSEPLSISMLGKVHRGTPWQSIYLKSADVSDSTWRSWTGNTSTKDARHSKPKRDWSLVTLIASLLYTNSPQDLLSINSTDTNAWLATLNGLAVLTNSASDEYLMDYTSPLFDELTMKSNSTPATVIEQAIRTARSAQPNQLFHEVGDLLTVPALSTESPWLNRSSEIQLELGLTDEAYERIPAQLLARVRADSWGSMEISPDGGRVQFAGLDGFPYRIELSTNLIDWQPVATNLPVNGVFELVVPVEAGSHFYRSVTIP